MTESGFHKVTREGIERNITVAQNAGDAALANYHLDRHPSGHLRSEVSLEVAHAIASNCTPLRKVVAFNPYRKKAA